MDKHRSLKDLSISEIRIQLQDPLFVEYFNIFLALPIFGQNIQYVQKSHSNEFNPPIKRLRYNLDELKLMEWYARDRFPLFAKTDLFREYRLATIIKSQVSDSISSRYGKEVLLTVEEQMEQHKIKRLFKNYKSLRRFMKFIKGTLGENTVSLWLQLDKVISLSDQNYNGNTLGQLSIQRLGQQKNIYASPTRLKQSHSHILSSNIMSPRDSMKPSDDSIDLLISPAEYEKMTLVNALRIQFFYDGLGMGEVISDGINQVTNDKIIKGPNTSSFLMGVSYSSAMQSDDDAAIDKINFYNLQASVMQRIKLYWVKRYLIHYEKNNGKIKFANIKKVQFPLNQKGKPNGAFIKSIYNFDNISKRSSSKQSRKSKSPRSNRKSLLAENSTLYIATLDKGTIASKRENKDKSSSSKPLNKINKDARPSKKTNDSIYSKSPIVYPAADKQCTNNLAYDPFYCYTDHFKLEKRKAKQKLKTVCKNKKPVQYYSRFGEQSRDENSEKSDMTSSSENYISSSDDDKGTEVVPMNIYLKYATVKKTDKPKIPEQASVESLVDTDDNFSLRKSDSTITDKWISVVKNLFKSSDMIPGDSVEDPWVTPGTSGVHVHGASLRMCEGDELLSRYQTAVEEPKTSTCTGGDGLLPVTLKSMAKKMKQNRINDNKKVKKKKWIKSKKKGTHVNNEQANENKAFNRQIELNRAAIKARLNPPSQVSLNVCSDQSISMAASIKTNKSFNFKLSTFCDGNQSNYDKLDFRNHLQSKPPSKQDLVTRREFSKTHLPDKPDIFITNNWLEMTTKSNKHTNNTIKYPVVIDKAKNWIPNSDYSGCFRKRNELLVATLVSDHLAGFPFRRYLITNRLKNYLTNHRLWYCVQDYLSCQNEGTNGSECIALRKFYGVSILRMLRGNGGTLYDGIPLTDDMGTRLGKLIELGQGDSVLRRLQDYICMILRTPIYYFHKRDIKCFSGAVMTRKDRALSRLVESGPMTTSIYQDIKLPSYKRLEDFASVLEHKDVDEESRLKFIKNTNKAFVLSSIYDKTLTQHSIDPRHTM